MHIVDKICLERIIIAIFAVATFLCASSCSVNDMKNLNEKFAKNKNISEDFIDFINKKGIKLEDVKDAYEGIEFAKYLDLENIYENGEIKTNAFIYEGDIEYYDENNNVLRTDKDVKKVLLVNSEDDLANEGITEEGYLTDGFGEIHLDEGIYKFEDNYYYVSGSTHKVVSCSNATMSELIKINSKKIVTKGKDRYIEYAGKFKNGELAKNQLSNIDGDIYLTDENGMIVTEKGMHRVNNIYEDTFHLIYEGLDGRFRKNKDRYFDCYIGDDGKVIVGDMINIDNKIYFADFEGRLLQNEYLWTGAYFDENMTLSNKDMDMHDAFIKYILNSINRTSLEYDKNDRYKFYNEDSVDGNPIEESLSMTFIQSRYKNYNSDEYSGTNIYVYEEEDLVKNKVVVNRDDIYYVGDDNRIQRNQLINNEEYKLLIDNNYRVVKDKWIFDKEYYSEDKKTLARNTAPYIREYSVDREIIKDYIGYYILSTGEIMFDDIYIESAIVDKDKNLICLYKVKNGEYDGTYDEQIYKLDTFEEGREECNYEEVSEGEFLYVHRYKDKDRKEKIDDNNIDEQLKYRYVVDDEKYKKIFSDILDKYRYKETVKFGSYPNHDKSGKIFEPIEWKILTKHKNEKETYALLFSEKIIDVKEFDVDGNVDYEESSIRKWLTDDFYNTAFSDEEKERITRIDNDLIFLITLNRYKRYFDDDEAIRTTGFAYRDDNSIITFTFRNFWFSSINFEDDKTIDSKGAHIRPSRTSPKEVGGVRPAIWVKFNND